VTALAAIGVLRPQELACAAILSEGDEHFLFRTLSIREMQGGIAVWRGMEVCSDLGPLFPGLDAGTEGSATDCKENQKSAVDGN
jgi:hypothetical protein